MRCSGQTFRLLLLCQLIISIVIVWPASSSAKDIEVRIGLRAHRGVEKALKRWQPTAERLSREIPGYHFTMIPSILNTQLDQAVSRDEFDFILTNPSSTVENQLQHGVKSLVTLINKRQGKGYTQFGSVIFTRSDRKDINKLTDLKGKIFMGVDKRGFGGWRVAWQELLHNEITPYRDFRELRFAGGVQDKVVYSVRDGVVDAGSVRTDMLERMASKGEINLSRFKVLSLKRRSDFPFLLSTRLFPEWAFSKTRLTSDALASKVKYVLLSIKADDSAAKKGKYMGWVDALNYGSVRDLLEELKLGPFHVSDYNILPGFMHLYGHYFILGFMLIILVSLIVFYLIRLNRKLGKMQRQLKSEAINRLKIENSLAELASQSVERTRGTEFFRECVCGLARLYGMQFIYIILLDDTYSNNLRTFLTWENGQFKKNLECEIDGTPCYGLLKNQVELISSGLRNQYPDNSLLERLKAESFFGSMLKTSSGQMLGMISMMDSKELNIQEWQQPVLKIFANRIGLELQRIKDEEEMRGMSDQISWQVIHDPLTQLINRHNFERHLSQSIIRLEFTDKIHLLFHVDLDKFSLVNKACGHLAGNELLKQFARQLKVVMSDNDIVCRLGGDEFGILVLDAEKFQATQIAEKLLDFIHAYQYKWKNNTFDITASIGVVVLDNPRVSVNAALNAVDTARLAAKDNAGDQYCFYDEKIHQPNLLKSEAKWLEDVMYALKEDGFVLYHQAMQPMSGKFSNRKYVEILLRMKLRNGELKCPGSFFEIAGRHKLMPAIDRWVIENIFCYIRENRSDSNDVETYVINLSGSTLNERDFFNFISQKQIQYDVSPKEICFEISEITAIDNYSVSVDFIRRLRREGFSISLDNFGSGLSSYKFIKNMPLDFIKLDGSFIKGINDEPMNKAIIDSIVRIGRSMGIKTVATCVETDTILDDLRLLGIDFVQGYAICKPEPLAV